MVEENFELMLLNHGDLKYIFKIAVSLMYYLPNFSQKIFTMDMVEENLEK